jgi:selenocysteine lyase/cysteine desulfurase
MVAVIVTIRSSLRLAVTARLFVVVLQVADAGRRLGFTVPEKHADHIVGLYPSAAMPDAEWLVAWLEAKGLYVAARWGAVRVSPFLYNTIEEVHHLCELLKEALQEHAAALLHRKAAL